MPSPAGRTPTRRSPSRTGSPATRASTSNASATAAAPCSSARPRRRSSAASTSPGPSCTARRTTRGSTGTRPADRRAEPRPRSPAGIVTLATGGDGGGSIRIPAGFCGLVGLKSTFGRIPLSPMAAYGNLTVVVGCVSRSVRDTARWFDVCNGHDARDPLSLARVEGWEDGLGTHFDELRGLRVAVVPDWGGATVSPIIWELLEEAAGQLIADCGLVRVDGVDTKLPRMGAAWSISGMIVDRLRARRALAGLCRRPDARDPRRARTHRGSVLGRCTGARSSAAAPSSTRPWRASSTSPTAASTS